MKLYDCKVNLGGQIVHFAPKSGVSAAEVMLLREMHGHDNVREIVLVGDDRRSHRLEREALVQRYDVEGKPRIAAIFTRLFGPVGSMAKLPDAIVVDDADEADEGEAPEVPAPAPGLTGTLSLKGAAKAA